MPIAPMNGTVVPPVDMMEAARKSVTPEQFKELMRRTCGQAPTPRELARFCDEIRGNRPAVYLVH